MFFHLRQTLIADSIAPAQRIALASITKLIQGVVLKTWSESEAVMVCSNVCRGRR